MLVRLDMHQGSPSKVKIMFLSFPYVFDTLIYSTKLIRCFSFRLTRKIELKLFLTSGSGEQLIIIACV
jgi:hypothetical protein